MTDDMNQMIEDLARTTRFDRETWKRHVPTQPRFTYDQWVAVSNQMQALGISMRAASHNFIEASAMMQGFGDAVQKMHKLEPWELDTSRFARFATWVINRYAHECAPPDEVIGGDPDLTYWDVLDGRWHNAKAYMLRWYVTPWSRTLQRLEREHDRETGGPLSGNVKLDVSIFRSDTLRQWKIKLLKMLPKLYLHLFLRSDDDRALHDHPSWHGRIILRGSYFEWLQPRYEGDKANCEGLRAGDWKFMQAKTPHRVELINKRPVWTLFTMGPSQRKWGFHTAEGWMSYLDYIKRFGKHST